MTWQEYQAAVGKLYEQMNEMGVVKNNVYLPDKITNQKRQIDTLWELQLGDHQIRIIIDAKKSEEKIDVKDLEGVMGLAHSVNANKVIIVTNNGWTEPTEIKAKFHDVDLKILTIEEALDLVVPNKWFMCYECPDECVVMDSDGVLYRENIDLFYDWYAGKCRSCNDIYFHCPQCGDRKIFEDKEEEYECNCEHVWKKEGDKLFIKFNDLLDFRRIDNVKQVPVEFIFCMLRYPKEYWAHLIFSVFNIDTDKGNDVFVSIGPNGQFSLPDGVDEDGPYFSWNIN
ncbi:restriction endonuclease [uncultured Fluviicola sp.]|uniref:restriction endonuclease n=1 Tax=uncultured Fluviicola sp. TaxID=463303 RepID=UPI0025F51B96|nr:restriction endonuclease [uncultured Fluviicola sp.]